MSGPDPTVANLTELRLHREATAVLTRTNLGRSMLQLLDEDRNRPHKHSTALIARLLNLFEVEETPRIAITLGSALSDEILEAALALRRVIDQDCGKGNSVGR